MVRLSVLLLALGLPAAAADLFVDQIHPVLSQRCLACHSGARPQAGLSLESRAQMMKAGGELVLKKIRGQAGLRMPPAGDALTAQQVAAFERWIGEGAVWPDMKAAASSWVAPLAPRRVEVPAGMATNPIDRFLAVYARQHKVRFPAVADNARFYRRAYYDAWGLPPTAGKEANREALVDALLAGNKAYAAHWISFWNDLLAERHWRGVSRRSQVGKRSMATRAASREFDSRPHPRRKQKLWEMAQSFRCCD